MKVAALVVAIFLGLVLSVSATPLDDYIKAPDPTYSWRVYNSFRSTVLGYTGYNIELYSQTWMTANQTNQPVRSFVFTVPLRLRSSSSFSVR